MSKKTKKPKDPNAPKRPQSSYFLYMNERRPSLQKLHHGKPMSDIAKLISAEWKSLTDKTKNIYIEQAAKLQNKHKIEMEEYKKSSNYKKFQKVLARWKQQQQDIANHNHSSHPSSSDNRSNNLSMKRKGPAPFRCIDCDLRFSDECKFNQHNKEFHLEDIDSDDLDNHFKINRSNNKKININNTNNKKPMGLDEISGGIMRFCSNEELKQKINVINGSRNELIKKYKEQMSGVMIKSLSNLHEIMNTVQTVNSFKTNLQSAHEEQLELNDQIMSNKQKQLELERMQYKTEQIEMSVIAVEGKKIDENIKRYQEMIEKLKVKKEKNEILIMKKKKILNEKGLILNQIKKECDETNETMKNIRETMQYTTNSMESLNKEFMNDLERYEANYDEWSVQDVIVWIKCIESGKYNDAFYVDFSKQIEIMEISGDNLGDLRNQSVLKLIGLNIYDQREVTKNVDRVINRNKSNEPRQDECTICASKRINSVFIPCGHQFCCFQCYEKSKQKYANCPICRKEVTKTIRTFMNGF